MINIRTIFLLSIGVRRRNADREKRRRKGRGLRRRRGWPRKLVKLRRND